MPRGEHVLEGVEIEMSDFFGWITKDHIYSNEKHDFSVSAKQRTFITFQLIRNMTVGRWLHL